MNGLPGHHSAWNAGYLSPNKDAPPAARLSEDELLKKYGSLEKILARGKFLTRNNWLANSARVTMIDYLVSNRGMKPIGGSDIAKDIWTRWSSGYVDDRGIGNWVDLQTKIVAGCVDGDILIRIVMDENATGIQTRVQLIDGSLIMTPSELNDDENVSLGVELENGIESGYWVFKGKDTGSKELKNFEYIPRFDDAGHEVALLLRNPDPGMVRQSRGLPMVTPVIPEVEDVAQMSTSAVRGAIVKNSISVIARTNRPAQMQKALTQQNSDGTNTTIYGKEGKTAKLGNISDGSILTLPADDGNIQTISHQGNMDMVQLAEHVIRCYAAGVSIPFEILLSKFSGINFSAGKLAFDKFYRKLGRWEQAIAGKAFDMIRRSVVYEGMLLRGLTPTYSDLVVDAWIGAGRPDPDPQRSSSAENNRLAAGTTLRSEIVTGRTGMSYEVFLKALKAEQDLETEIFGKPLETPAMDMDMDFEKVVDNA